MEIKCKNCKKLNDSKKVICEYCGDGLWSKKSSTNSQSDKILIKNNNKKSHNNNKKSIKFSNINKSGVSFFVCGISIAISYFIVLNVSNNRNLSVDEIQNFMNIAQVLGLISIVSILVGGFYLMNYEEENKNT